MYDPASGCIYDEDFDVLDEESITAMVDGDGKGADEDG
jgi:hypothetical protein